jgi:hypothetical protein
MRPKWPRAGKMSTALPINSSCMSAAGGKMHRQHPQRPPVDTQRCTVVRSKLPRTKAKPSTTRCTKSSKLPRRIGDPDPAPRGVCLADGYAKLSASDGRTDKRPRACPQQRPARVPRTAPSTAAEASARRVVPSQRRRGGAKVSECRGGAVVGASQASARSEVKAAEPLPAASAKVAKTLKVNVQDPVDQECESRRPLPQRGGICVRQAHSI